MLSLGSRESSVRPDKPCRVVRREMLTETSFLKGQHLLHTRAFPCQAYITVRSSVWREKHLVELGGLGQKAWRDLSLGSTRARRHYDR